MEVGNVDKSIKIWKGKFAYNPAEYGIIDDVYFELYVEVVNGSFEGKCYDDEFRDLCDQLSAVKGFFENDIISFVVTYPVSYSMDENEKVTIDQTKKGHDVIYHGTFNSKQNTWSGEWEILAEPEKENEGFVQNHSTGSWEMTM